MAQQGREENTTINQLLVLCFRVVVAVAILLLLLRHRRRQPQRGDGQEVEQRQRCSRGRRGLRRRARRRLAVAAGPVDVILTERDVEVPLPGLHLVLEGKEDDALRPHLPQLRLRQGRRRSKLSRRRKHLCSAVLGVDVLSSVSA